MARANLKNTASAQPTAVQVYNRFREIGKRWQLHPHLDIMAGLIRKYAFRAEVPSREAQPTVFCLQEQKRYTIRAIEEKVPGHEIRGVIEQVTREGLPTSREERKTRIHELVQSRPELALCDLTDEIIMAKVASSLTQAF